MLLQRVCYANVNVAGESVGAIDKGLLVLLGIDRDDDEAKANRLLKKLLAYRVFPDAAGKMNLSVSDINAGVLLVSQFTLSADTGKGLRPGFSSAAAPDEAEILYEYVLQQLRLNHATVACGQFGADMQVSLTNDGPVTFMLQN